MESTINLGSLPVDRGAYAGATNYYKLNEVTSYGMMFRAKVGTLEEPLTGYAPTQLNASGKVELINADKWELVAGTPDIYNEAQRLTKVENDMASLDTDVRASVAELEELYEALTQSDIIVGTLPASGVKNKIYRVPGTTSYADWMWDGTQFVKMAEYNNAIDNTPTKNSNNLVKSGGVEAAIASLKAIVEDLEAIAEGYVRVAGSSSPALSYKSYKYHEQGGFGKESAFSLFYPCLVGTKLTGDYAQVGKILHVLRKLDWNHDIDGNARAIDGSEGDVQVVNIDPYYRIMGKHTIDGTEYDVFLMSRSPFTWQGIDAEEVAKYGIAPDYCVSHTDTDSVVRMHSAYNPDWNGSYSAPAGVVGKYVQSVDSETGDISETYDGDETLLGGAGGLHSTDITLYDGEQHSMNMNPDTTKPVPFMNQTAEMCNNMQALMLSEGGTFDAHNASLMGSGFSSNDPATAAADWEESGSGAKNGMRIKDKNDTWKYYSMASNVNFLFGEASGTRYAANCINSWRNPWHIMEAQRAVCHAIQNGVHEQEWFVFEGNKYKYRSITGFNGPSQGEMTCVVWKFMATKAGASAVDPTDRTTSIAGNRVEILVSTALLHGITTQVSPSWWVSGLIFTEDENGAYKAYMERDQASLIKSENGEILVSESFNFENLYPQIGETISNGSGYATNYLNEALMMPDTNGHSTGGGLHTYVGKYNYFTGTAAGAGKKLVRGFRRGYYAYASALSPLFVYAVVAPSIAFSNLGFGTVVRIVE